MEKLTTLHEVKRETLDRLKELSEFNLSNFIEIAQNAMQSRYSPSQLISFKNSSICLSYMGIPVIASVGAQTESGYSFLFTYVTTQTGSMSMTFRKMIVYPDLSITAATELTETAVTRLPLAVNGKKFTTADEITLVAGDIQAESGWSPTDDKDLATKKYVDDHGGGGGGGGSLPSGTANGDILVWDNTNQEWVVKTPSRLPAKYQEVEYIKSTGTQYIDTGYVPKSTTRWELIYQTITGSSDLSCRNGRHGGGDGERFSIGAASIDPLSFTSSTNSMSVHIGSPYETTVSFAQKIGSTSRDYPYALTRKKVTIDASNMTYDMNDGEWSGTISATLTLANQSHLYLFARSFTDGTFDGCGTQNIYSHKIWENGVKVQDFVPCYRIADGVIGMYDIVNGVFYTNAGTGTFIKGADV